MRRAIIAANWKMNKTIREAVEFAYSIKEVLKSLKDRICVVCPPFTALAHVQQELVKSEIQLGAQNLFWESDGAYTGEVSARMLKDVGCQYVIIGHSERRRIFAENDEMINRKIKKALSEGLTPIICVGETLEEREKGITFDVIRAQTSKDFEGLKKDEAQRCVIAYEPVWAIGTGRNATPDQAQEVHAYIRGLLKDYFGGDLAQNISIQYGGSVKPDNIDDLMSEADIDGALVGGASLDVKSFARIVQFNVK